MLGAVDTGVGGGAQSVSSIASCAGVGCGGASLTVGWCCALKASSCSRQGVTSSTLSADVGGGCASETVGLLGTVETCS